MEQNKGFWYADWSFPIFVGLLSSGVFAGTHMYYLYGIGAFNEVAFVAMLKSGIDTGVYGAVAAFGASFLFARIIEATMTVMAPLFTPGGGGSETSQLTRADAQQSRSAPGGRPDFPLPAPSTG